MSSVRRAHTPLPTDDHLLPPPSAQHLTPQFHPSMSSPPHSVPLEVLERILRLAFEPTDPPSFTPAPSPPRGTSHLLLVSRGVRELCLPHFWRAVTIAQPSDWVTLFDKDTGLFNMGEEGRRRWAWVEELSVFASAVVPVKMEAIDIQANPCINLLHPLELPTFRRLPRLLLDCNPFAPSARLERAVAVEKEREKALGELILAALSPADLATRYDHYNLWDRRDPKTLKDSTDQLRKYFRSEYKSDLLWRARMRHCVRVLSAFQPVHLRLSAREYHREYETDDGRYLEDVEQPDLIEVVGADGSDEDLAGDEFRDLLQDVQSMWPRARCRLVHLSEKSREGVEWILQGSPLVNRSKWDSSWNWTRADGSEFTIDFATNKET